MASFTDKSGTAWQVALTVGHLPALKEFGVDPWQATRSQEAFAALYELEPQKLVSALYLVCEEQIERAKLTPERWAHLFDGPTVERATDALADAVIDFFPRQRIAVALRGKIRTLREKADLEVVRKIEAVDLTSNGPAGSSAASSD